jgi:hypothetical protein
MFNKIKMTYILVFSLIACFGLQAMNAMEEAQPAITYSIEQTPNDRNTLTIRMTSVPPNGGLLILGSASFIQPQVENLICGGKVIKEDAAGYWLIPDGAHDLHWQVRLKDSKETDVDAQQSVKYDTAILLSVASSLPRFKNSPRSEIIKISMPTVKTTYPEPNQDQTIPLPDHSKPPLFILLNFTNCGSKTQGPVTLTYLLDDPNARSLVPDMDANIKGLTWLKDVTGVNDAESFAVGWCKSYAEKPSISGAAGSGILLANYLHNKSSPSVKALMLYVALHEAFHQFQAQYPDEPSWVQESLASYYGSRAVEVAIPEEGPALMKRFKDAAAKFPKGLLTIHTQVEQGNRTDYGAFYTKGVAFWAAVNEALRTQEDSLDAHLNDILSKTKYGKDGAPLNLHTILGLSEETWTFLWEEFLR